MIKHTFSVGTYSIEIDKAGTLILYLNSALNCSPAQQQTKSPCNVVQIGPTLPIEQQTKSPCNVVQIEPTLPKEQQLEFLSNNSNSSAQQTDDADTKFTLTAAKVNEYLEKFEIDFRLDDSYNEMLAKVYKDNRNIEETIEMLTNPNYRRWGFGQLSRNPSSIHPLTLKLSLPRYWARLQQDFLFRVMYPEYSISKESSDRLIFELDKCRRIFDFYHISNKLPNEINIRNLMLISVTDISTALDCI